MNNKPFISAKENLPEITIKAFVLGVLLTIILGASNAYLALKVGTSVSASIPAAVISLGVLRFFKNSNVLENNMVQTMASIGEAATSGIIFILPALIILHIWTHFDYMMTTIVTVFGGILGVLTMSIVRRVMVNNKELHFPEGTAVSEVLKASADKNSDLKPLLGGGFVGGMIVLFQTGFQVIANGFQAWWFEGKTLMGFGLGFSPALLAAGYIIGVNVAISMLIGVLIGWVFGVPLCAHFFGVPTYHHAADTAMYLWKSHIRYLGIGTMLVGGFWTLIVLIKPVVQGVALSMRSLHEARKQDSFVLPRTQKDIPIIYVLWGVFAYLVVCYLLVHHFGHAGMENLGASLAIYSMVAALFAVLAGIAFASISAYFSGLVGATNCPASGLIVSSLMLFTLMTLGLLKLMNIPLTEHSALIFSAIAVLLCSLISSAIAVANDSIQDLKSGQILGATPWKQQVILCVGVVVAALVASPVIELLFNAYGIGGVFPHPHMSKSQMLAAPQAAMMSAVVKGIFDKNIEWSMISLGGLVAVIIIVFDFYLKTKKNTRLPVLAVGLGIYLPLSTSVPSIIGGFLAYFSQRALKKKVGTHRYYEDKVVRKKLHKALMVACGMVAGASLMGVILAVPFAIEKNSDALKLISPEFIPYANFLGIVATGIICYGFYRMLNSRNPAK